MPFSPPLEEAIAAAGARVIVGFPRWMRPFLAKNVVGITLGRWIFLDDRPPEKLEPTLWHELVHVEQVTRLGLPRFLVSYALEFLRHFYAERNVDRAYRKISFEVEAYEREKAKVL